MNTLPAATLLCPVRACRLPLQRFATGFRCDRGHSFDVARAGYLNLLQPQDRRSRTPGDSLEAVRARRRSHDQGLSAPLLAAIAGLLKAQPGEPVLDAGCGEGFFPGMLAAQTGIAAHGIDISTAAIEAAARRYPSCQWVVANADRFIPFQDSTFAAILSITGRRHPAEFARVLAPGGRLLVVIPAPGDLAELRGPATRDRVPAVMREFEPGFRLEAQTQSSSSALLSPETVQDILHSIYRPDQRGQGAPLTVTFSFDLLLFRLA